MHTKSDEDMKECRMLKKKKKKKEFKYVCVIKIGHSGNS